MMVEENDSNEQEQEEEDDIDFYEEVLLDLRSRRLEEQQQQQQQRERKSTGKWFEDDLTESTSSLSFLSSWATTSHDDASSCMSLSSCHSEHDTFLYWNELRRGRTPPVPVLKKKKQPQQRHSDGASLPELLAQLKPRSSMYTTTAPPASFHQQQSSGIDLGEHAERVRSYRYSAMDLHHLCFDVEGRDFFRLQKSLRKEGAVTNALLKQVLPAVVQQAHKKRLARQQQYALEMEPERHPTPPVPIPSSNN